MSEIVLFHHNEAMTTSLAIAEGVELKHKNVIELIRKHAESLSEFGGVAFETRPFETDGGTQWRDIAFLNEQQSTLLITFMRNSPIVVKFKVALVKAFFELRDRVAAEQIPQPNGTLFLSHAADILVAADRSFRAAIRSGRSAGLGTANAIRRANEIARVRTGINMLSELQAHEHVAAMDAQPAAAVEPVEVDAGGLQQFWAEYEGGGLAGGACIPLLSTQAYDIYKDWCGGANIDPLNLPRMVNGLRVAGLVRNVRKRFVNSRGVTHGPCAFLIPAGPLDMTPHLSETRWLGECVAQIDAAMAL